MNCKTFKKILTLILLLALPYFSVQAQLSRLIDLELQGGVMDEGEGIEITEFIFNKTITKVGSDFYNHFFQHWSNPSGVVGLSVYIEERPVPGMGVIITVRVEDRQVYGTSLRPGYQEIIDAAQAAIEQTQSYFIDYEIDQEQMESQDFSGSGIY